MVAPAIIGGAIAGGTALAGNAINWLSGKRQAEKNVQFQKDYAQNSIQWRTADARKAGIHPLAAMGMPLQQYQPVSIGSEPGRGIAAAGYHMGQAFTRKARIQDVKLDLEYKRLRNLEMARKAGVLPMIEGNQATKNDQWQLSEFAPEAYRVENYGPGVSPVVKPGTKMEVMPSQKRLPVPATQGGGIDEDPMGFFQRFGLNFYRYLTSMNYPWDKYLPDRQFKKSEARLSTKPKQPPPKGQVWWYFPVSGTWGPIPIQEAKRLNRKMPLNQRATRENFKKWQKFRGVR